MTYFGGKQELIKKGYFDDIDMAMMFHSLDMGGKNALIGPVSNGFIGKKVRFIGQESHAGSAPEEGINALNAAMLAINNIHAQRETFKDSDKVRVHPIITKGGDIVNSVPADVQMESYVRARTIDGMLDSNNKVDRALKAGAMALTVIDLLFDDASLGKQILNNFTPAMTKKEYLSFMESVDGVELFEA